MPTAAFINERINKTTEVRTMRQFILILMLLPMVADADVWGTFYDVENYEDAKLRLGKAPLVGDLQRYNYQIVYGDDQVITLQRVDDGTHDDQDVTPEPIEPEPSLFDRTSRAQMLGCLTRWDNQVNSGSITTILNSLSSMFDDKETINNCIEDIRAVVRAAE